MILVLGSNGQVGHELKRQLLERGYELLSPTRDELDLSNLDAVKTYLQAHQPTSMINAAAYTQVDKAESEPQSADMLNHRLPHTLAEYSQQTGAYLLHYSTDYVYAGQGTKPQDENAPLIPQSVYGKTKLAGEMAIQATTNRYSILRTSWVYSYRGHNFMNTMLKLASQRDVLTIVDDQVGTPTSADILATFSILAYEERLKGIYNLTQEGEVSWYGFAKAIFELARKNKRLPNVPKLLPIKTCDYPTPAIRPLNSRLDCGKLLKALDGVKLSDWKTGLSKEMTKQQLPGNQQGTSQ
ncbi:dTDP-4-dehydrorhamnose reductase [Saliniradius amylolyticus]|uniref:dTDP-4-dehydrorhamnose reductase n=2 Tax=Saliniradius amylolyticus TaxID=2183582 RepID=A0A2S2E0Q2_9ALTE|nr:dTDP-4-dehydrorhamnose reductase [Saliniradius amylolyticus]